MVAEQLQQQTPDNERPETTPNNQQPKQPPTANRQQQPTNNPPATTSWQQFTVSALRAGNVKAT
jgi:hypothetical protein